MTEPVVDRVVGKQLELIGPKAPAPLRIGPYAKRSPRGWKKPATKRERATTHLMANPWPAHLKSLNTRRATPNADARRANASQS